MSHLAEQLVLFFPGKTDLDPSVRAMQEQGYTIQEYETLEAFLAARASSNFEFAVMTYLTKDTKTPSMTVIDAHGKTQKTEDLDT